MRRLRLLLPLAIVLAAFGAFPALAGGPVYGTWTYSGSGTTWTGTMEYTSADFDSVAIGSTALTKNPPVSFTFGGMKCPVNSNGGAACFGKFTMKKKYTWKLKLKKKIKSSKQINTCLSVDGAHFHCRF